MSPPSKRRALGRGLSALMPNTDEAAQEDAPASDEGGPSQAPSRRDHYQVAIEDIHPNPEQPRRRFSETELGELAQSIEAHGIIQPVIVRTRNEGGYFLIAGERRWRAAQKAGLTRIPVVVQEVAAKEAFERALVENLQRSDLNAIEEAEAYQRLVDVYRYTQEQVAERVGKERSTVANSLRLLRLPVRVRRMVEDGAIKNGHAKALLALDDPAHIERTARVVADKKLSVRATESLVNREKRARAAEKPGAEGEPSPARKSASVRDLEERLTRSLGARVAVHENARGKGGRLEIQYIDLDDLDRLLARLLK